MAVNFSRSMGGDFLEGATDGALLKEVRDRGGVVEMTNAFNHAHTTGPFEGSANAQPMWGDAYKKILMHGIVRPRDRVLPGGFD